MPIARIITPDPASAAPVEEQLRGLGYQVEVITPQETAASLADLVVTVEKCHVDEALKRARKLARQTESDVFIAPGAVGEISAQRPSFLPGLWQRALGPLVQRRQRVATSSLARTEEQQTSTIAAPPAQLLEREPCQQAQLSSHPAPEPVLKTAEPVVAAEPQPGLKLAPASKFRHWQSQQWKPRPLAREHSIPEEVTSAPVAEQLKPRPSAKKNSIPEEVTSAPVPEQWKPRPSGRESSAPENWASAPEGNTPAPAQRPTASKAITSLKEHGRAAANYASGIALRLSAAKPPRRARVRPARVPVVPRRPRLPMREREWKLAAIAASAITIAVMLVWAGLANRRPASPIPAGVLSNDVQQQVPFGPVTLPAKAVVPAATPSRTQKSVSKPSPLHPAQAKPKGRSRRLQADDDEVIVRRFGSQRASTQAPARDGVKRYSDLE